ncbi:hypothetical protein [Henriciella aquimarina]|uniref:hypothetical protein n=1 Tax=Henriciella aquimarina TaxID=545261 RepID=UPI0009FF8474|nr:hypothetical protein [Henriciella aquimarina]
MKGGGQREQTWFDPHTLTLLAALAATGAAMLALVLSGREGIAAQTGLTGAGAICVMFLGTCLLTAQLLRLWAVWIPYSKALRTPTRARTDAEQRRIEHGFIEFFFYLAASLAGLSFVAYSASTPGAGGALPLHITGENTHPLHLIGFLVFFAGAFVPLMTGFVRQARLEAELRSDGREIRVLRTDVVSELSFWTSALLIAGIVLLAWAAAGDMFQMREDFGVFITFVVLLVFFVIILAPHVMRILNNWIERQEVDRAALGSVKLSGFAVMKPGVLTSRLDSILVRFVAPLSGATQHGPVWFTPHLLVLIVILPLSALGFVLAPPWGLVPIGAAMLIAVALGRRWAWVEEDRETASRLRTTRGNEIHIGFDNDLKDEALLGYASLFILVPLALHQLQGWTHAFVEVKQWSSNNAFIDWLRFFGAELAKAVPFVDWWEIYNVRIETPFDAAASENPLAKHLTFAARAMVDLVIMAALFQAIGLWQRSRADKRYYKAGQLDVFDPFTETAFFERGMWFSRKAGRLVPKKRFKARVEEHVQARLDRDWDGNPYNPDRLAELSHSDNPDVRAGAAWMIWKYKVLVGSPTEQLRQLSLRLAENADKLDRSVGNRSFARRQKLDFEKILQELRDNRDVFGEADVPNLLGALEAVRLVPEFEYAQLQAVHLLRERPSVRATHALCAMLMQDRHRETEMGGELWATWKRELGISKSVFLEKFQSRMDVAFALREHGNEYFALRNKAMLKEIADFMDWMGQISSVKFGTRGDKSKAVRELAREIESELRALLRM